MWFWSIVVLTVLILLGAVVSIIPVYVDFRITKNGSDEEALVAMRAVWGLVYHEFRIPLLALRKTSTGESAIVLEMEQRDSKDKPPHHRRRSFSLGQLLSGSSKKQSAHEAGKRSRKDFIRYLLHHTQFEHFHWITKIGMEDPALTGVLAGALWAAKGVVTAKISSLVALPADRSVNVTPVYGTRRLDTDLTCILRTSLSHIIVASLKLAWNARLLKTRGTQQ